MSNSQNETVRLTDPLCISDSPFTMHIFASIALQFAVLLAPPAMATPLPGPHYSILQGNTSETEAHFTVVARNGNSLNFSVSSGAQIETADYTTMPGSPWSVYRLRAFGLNKDTNYELGVYDETGELKDLRFFRSLDPNMHQGRIAVVSCMLRQLHNPGIWREMSSSPNRPVLILFNGDATYLDRDNLFFAQNPTSARQAWDNYAYSRNTLDIYFWRELIPILAVWDDHDAGGNNVTYNDFPLMKDIREIFDTFFANEASSEWLEMGPGLAKTFDLFDTRFIWADGRSFRDTDSSSPQFGSLQEHWILNQMRPGLNVMINSTQFFGKFIEKDSYEYYYPESFSEFIEAVRKRSMQIERNTGVPTRIVFVSGDTHFSELQGIESDWLGYPTFEITSSSAHSFGVAGHQFLKPGNPRRIASTGAHNFVLMEWIGLAEHAFQVRSVGANGGDRFSAKIEPFSSGKNCEFLLTGNQK